MEKKANFLFLILAGFFITNTLVAEFVGIKIFSLEQSFGFESFDWTIFGVDNLGFNLTAGVVLWPIVFVMTDVINEYYGVKGVKRLSYLSVLFVFYAFFMIYLAMKLSPNGWWDNESGMLNPPFIESMDDAFNGIFGQGLAIIIGSMAAFLIGQILDAFVFKKLKTWTGGKKVWLRATGSTLISQFIDSYVVLLIAFYMLSDWELSRVIAIGTVNYIYKFGMAVILTPVIYLAHQIIDRYLGENLAAKMKAEAVQ